MTKKFALRIAFMTAVTALTAAAAFGQSDHWVATWATSAQIYRAAPVVRPVAAPVTAVAATGAAATSATPAPAAPAPPPRPRGPQSFENQTVRMIIHTSIGGGRLRLELTNPFGGQAVEVRSAHIALRVKESSILPASDRVLTVNGSKSFKMIPGETLFSDAVDLEFAPMSDLAVSLFFPSDTGPLASHGLVSTCINRS